MPQFGVGLTGLGYALISLATTVCPSGKRIIDVCQIGRAGANRFCCQELRARMLFVSSTCMECKRLVYRRWSIAQVVYALYVFAPHRSLSIRHLLETGLPGTGRTISDHSRTSTNGLQYWMVRVRGGLGSLGSTMTCGVLRLSADIQAHLVQ